MLRGKTSKLKRGIILLCVMAMMAALVSGCLKREEEASPLLLSILLNCLRSCGCTAVNNEFSNPIKITINGYSGDAMEPFITRSGATTYLFFNSLNNGQDTSLYCATRVDDVTFTSIGKIDDVNGVPPHLDAVASMDINNNFYYISTRDWPTNYHNVMTGVFTGGAVPEVPTVTHLDGNFYIESPGWIVMDGEINHAGDDYYFVNARFSGGSVPDSSDIGVAYESGGAFYKYANSASIMASINTGRCLEYAPSISADGLELFFTRLQLSPIKSEILLARRSATTAPFGAPERIGAISGFVEAPSLTSDGKTLYYHMNYNSSYAIYKVSRP